MGKLLVLDVGGTFIKYGLADERGTLIQSTVRQTPSHAEEDAGAFFGALKEILSSRSPDTEKACVSIAGPFDFDSGVSLMRHKFLSLYGQSLRPPFEECGLPVSFLHDSTAFMLGEYHFGFLQGAKNACCVMLGTGLGFAWVKDGRVCVNEAQTPSFTLWNAPYRDGIAEDYVSTRAIQRSFGRALPVKQIAQAAREGDMQAKEAFRAAGRELSRMMAGVIGKLGCERFALGGQISKSADLLELNLPVPWAATAHPDDAALMGAGRYAALGREKCVQTVRVDFGPLKGKDEKGV